MSKSILIRGGIVVNADMSERTDVLISHGKIIAMGEGLKGDTVIDAGGCYVMPGGIDPHTHMDMPFMGTTTADDFESGTMAGLAGGTTMTVDFCLPAPGESMLKAYQAWRHKGEKAAADYSFHMAVTQWSPMIHDEMETVVKTYGINSFKHFMAYKGALMVNDDEMYNSFKRCAELGALPLVHAENGDVVARMQADLLARGITGPEGHSYSRPPEVEGEAANRAIMIANMAGVPLYIVHVSCEDTHEAIRRAKMAGQRVYGEPLIQFLTLDDSEYQNKDWDYAAGRVMSPPFRNKKHQDSLWAGLQSGTLSVVATDHATFTKAQKRMGAKSFTQIPNGTGGLEDRMPVLWNSGVNTGRLTKEEFVNVTSTNIAKILNMYPRKGVVRTGSDADIVIWDPKGTKTITAAKQQSRSGYSVFEGTTCTGIPRTVISRGKVAWEQGDMRAKAGDGDFVARAPFTSVHQANAIWKGVSAPKPVQRIEVTP
jgi:dihydropyrimidinase